MSDNDSDTVYMQNRQTEEIHKLHELEGGELQSLEECNIDAARDAGALDVLEEADALRIVAERPELKCGHCWPEAEAEAEAEASS